MKLIVRRGLMANELDTNRPQRRGNGEQAVNVIREESWDNRRLKDGTWRNHSPRCAEEANPDLDLAGLQLFKKPVGE